MKIKTPLRATKRWFKSFTHMGRITETTAHILPNFACIDVGASYYPHPAWELFRRSRRTHWIAIDPNKENLSYLDNWSYPCKTSRVAMGLSETGGSQTLFKTNIDSGSSLLKPVIHPSEVHRHERSYFFPVKEILINTTTLGEVVASHGLESPLAIKLDTQGTELAILKGLGSEPRKNLVAVDIEVTLRANPIMQGSARFYDVQEFLERSGMELVYLNPIESPPKNRHRALKGRGLLNECDAVFLMRRDLAEALGADFLLGLLGMYVSYKLFDEARPLAQFLTEHSGLTPEQKDGVVKLYHLL